MARCFSQIISIRRSSVSPAVPTAPIPPALPFGLALLLRRAWQIILRFISTSMVMTRCRRSWFSYFMDHIDDALPEQART